MNIHQFIKAADDMGRVFSRCVWTVELDVLPKIERIAKFAYKQLQVKP